MNQERQEDLLSTNAGNDNSGAEGLLAIIDQIREADVRAILNRVQAGEPLTAAQKARLDEYLHEKNSTASPDAELVTEFADTVTALALALNCDRKTVQRYMKVEGNPGSDAGGKFNVGVWKQWVEEHDRLRRKRPKNESKIDAELRSLLLRNEKIEIENKVRRGQLADVDEVCKVLGDLFGTLVQSARGVKHHLAPQVVGVEVGEASKRIGREMEELLNRLALGEWAKKKVFWSKVYAQFSDLRRKYSLGNGASSMF
ncbi:MAG: hypothetical protein LBH01_01085 [Verrucomicrobiales bacterium]|nr:hypothetical protein [Verrucomicrobiales bacterium]